MLTGQQTRIHKAPVILAILAVSLFHGGVIYGFTTMSPFHQEEVVISTNPSGLVMHAVTLAGVDSADEITHQHDDEELLNEANPEEMREDDTPPLEEPLPDEPDEPEVIEEQVEKTPEPIKEPEPMPEPEPVIEPKKEEIIATEKPTPEAPKIVKPKQVVKKAEPKPKKVQPKPKSEQKRQSKRVENRVISVSEMKLLNQPAPNFPRAAKMRRMSGVVKLILKVDERGHVADVHLARSSGHDILDKEAIRVAKQVRMKPYIVNGVAQAISVSTEYEFKLQR